jgi:two-component system sensor histidine kinase FlrB
MGSQTLSNPAPAVSADEARGELAVAFSAFNDASRDLSAAYRALESEVQSLRKVDDVMARHQRLATMGEMATALAHQIRTPLSAALLYATNAQRPDIGAPQRNDLLGRAINCLHDLERLIGDMLQFARGEKLPRADFTLGDLIDSVSNAVRGSIGPGQTLSVTADPRDLTMYGSRESLAGAILNLVNNALQAAGTSGHVTVLGQRNGSRVEILVSDDGPGIEARIAAQIFEPFFTSRPQGTGLGLSVARSVARAHNGDIELLESPAGGATFALTLPVSETDGLSIDARREEAA